MSRHSARQIVHEETSALKAVGYTIIPNKEMVEVSGQPQGR